VSAFIGLLGTEKHWLAPAEKEQRVRAVRKID
jgi:hypothetical protein